MTLSSFHATAPTASYTLSLHDALPIYSVGSDVDHVRPEQLDHLKHGGARGVVCPDLDEQQLTLDRVLGVELDDLQHVDQDRKSTRLNSSHVKISYAVFCLKKKKKNRTE